MKRQSSKRFRAILLTFFIMGAGLSYLFVLWINAPTQQKVQIEGQANALPTTRTYKPIATKYFKAKIDEAYRVRTSENPHTPELVQTILFDTSGSGMQVGVTSSHLPSEGLEAISDYKYRLHTPASYTPYQYENMPPGAIAFKKADDTEISLFITNSSRYASITASGTSANGTQLLALITTIMESWVWIK